MDCKLIVFFTFFFFACSCIHVACLIRNLMSHLKYALRIKFKFSTFSVAKPLVYCSRGRRAITYMINVDEEIRLLCFSSSDYMMTGTHVWRFGDTEM